MKQLRVLVASLAVALVLVTGAVQGRPASAAPPAGGQAVARPGVLVPLNADPTDAFTSIPKPATPSGGSVVTATFIVNYAAGFTPQAQAAFQAAVDIWSTLITSSIPIRINATWQPAAANNLGEAGPYTFLANFTGAPLQNVWYPVAIANAITGVDQDPNEDIDANFNSSRGDWYLGTDGLTPAGKYDLESVVLHELGHGLGYLSSLDCTAAPNCSAGSMGTWGLSCGGCGTWPMGFDRFVVNGSNQSLINTGLFANPSTALFVQETSNGVFFNGPNAVAGNGGVNGKLYAPNSWSEGSSISHLDENTYPAGNPNSLMTPALSSAEAIHNPGPIVLGTLKDIGWPAVGGGGGPTCYTLTTSVAPLSSGSVAANPTNSVGCPSGQYTLNASVQLTASPNSGFAFASWSGALSGSVNPSNVTMSAAKSVTANFSGSGPACFTLTTSVSPAGAGSVGANPTSSSGCPSGQYTLNASVQLTASPNSGYAFSTWSGDLAGSVNPTNVTISANRNVTANFAVSGGGGGGGCTGGIPLVSGFATPATIPLHYWGYYCIAVPPGSGDLTVTLTGTGDVDLYTRAGSLPTSTSWVCRPYIIGSNESCDQANPASGTWYVGLYGYYGGSVSITATVSAGGGGASCFVLATTASPAGSGSVQASPPNSAGCPNGQYTLNASVQLSAAAAAGYSFVGWSGDLSGSANPSSITMSANRNVTANFVASGGGGGPATCTQATALTSGASQNVTVAKGAWAYYCITVPAGMWSLTVTINGSGNIDLYTLLGGLPDTFSFTCRSYLNQSVESCITYSPLAGDWYIGLHAVTGGTVSLTAVRQ